MSPGKTHSHPCRPLRGNQIEWPAAPRSSWQLEDATSPLSSGKKRPRYKVRGESQVVSTPGARGLGTGFRQDPMLHALCLAPCASSPVVEPIEPVSFSRSAFRVPSSEFRLPAACCLLKHPRGFFGYSACVHRFRSKLAAENLLHCAANSQNPFHVNSGIYSHLIHHHNHILD